MLPVYLPIFILTRLASLAALSPHSFQLMKGLARPDHPFSKFGTGNSSTIKDDPSTGVSVREALLAFHAKFYSADVMKLSVIGKESLEELEKMVVESFSDIPNKNVGNPVFSGEPYTAKELRKAMEVVPIKENRSLDIAFPLCAIRDFYKSKVSRGAKPRSEATRRIILARSGEMRL